MKLWPPLGSPGTLAVSWTNPPKLDPTPMQVVRRYPIHASTMALNKAYWALPGVKGTVFEHYMLVAAQWPTSADPPGPENDGAFFPGRTDISSPSKIVSINCQGPGEFGQHDHGNLLPGLAVELHGLPPKSFQRARARFRRHSFPLSLASCRLIPQPRHAHARGLKRACPFRLYPGHNFAREAAYIGGTTPFAPTTTFPAARAPSSPRWAGTKTAAPNFRSAAVAGARVTTGVSSGTDILFSWPR